MKPYVQEAPFAIQVEFTEGCNFSCTFCGLQGIREKPGNYKFLTTDVAYRIASEIARLGWNSRIEFAMHGEPSFNPARNELVSIFRTALPDNQLMMTSNGSGFVKDSIENISAVFQAGLNILALDDYKNANMVPRIREQLKGWKKYEKLKDKSHVSQHDYPGDGLQLSPHHRWPPNTMRIIYIQDIEEAVEGGHATLNNHCGAAFAPNDKGQGKRCAKPFRELSFRWDGSIAICCNDWRGQYKIGNIMNAPLHKLWHHPAFTAARKKLYHGERDFGPCKSCDATSYRVGLLPDHRGAVSLPKAGPEDLRAIKHATSGQTLTQIVLRPWEKK